MSIVLSLHYCLIHNPLCQALACQGAILGYTAIARPSLLAGFRLGAKYFLILSLDYLPHVRQAAEADFYSVSVEYLP